MSLLGKILDGDPDFDRAYLEDAEAIAAGVSTLPPRRVHLRALLGELQRVRVERDEMVDVNEALIVTLNALLKPATDPAAPPSRPQ